jgi:spore germination protein YaaH
MSSIPEKALYCIIPAFLISAFSPAQQTGQEYVSIHQSESEYHTSIKPPSEIQDHKGLLYPAGLNLAAVKDLTKKVLGWHPYWVSATAYQSYDYNALTHIAYFSYEVDTATGGYTSIHDWNSTPIISYAHEKGTKVLLTVTNFGNARNTELLTDTVKQKTLINTAITLVKNRNGDGINFDLESVSSTQRANLVSFLGRAVTMIKAQIPGAEISMATPAVDWSGAWDFKALSQLCDYLIVMGYDYYWRGSTTAGPVAPLEGETYNVTKTVNTYLSAGVESEKLLLGVPWYGYDWPVVSDARKAAATGTATSRVYTAAESLAEDHGKIFDLATKVPWAAYNASSAWRQLWYDDSQSLGLKYGLVNSANLGGIGIWALSYEGGDPDIWGTISGSFIPYDTTSGRILKLYPNPMKESCTIIFSVVSASRIQIDLFDTMGRKVRTIAEREFDEGVYTEVMVPESLAAGIYICVLRNGKSTDTRKLIITK